LKLNIKNGVPDLRTRPANSANGWVLFFGRYRKRRFISLFRVLTWLLGIGIFTAQHAAAQSFDPELHNATKIDILPVAIGNPDVRVGDTYDTLQVIQLPNSSWQSELLDVFWVAEPANAARIITPIPTDFVEQPVTVEFLKATRVTITAYAYVDESLGFDFIQNDEDDGVFREFTNRVSYIFNVQGNDETTPDAQQPEEGEETPAQLNVNQRSTQTVFDRACVATRQSLDEASSIKQVRFIETCDALALQDDVVQSMDNIAAEELFAISDSLTVTADYHISSIQSRLTAVRSGQRKGFDVSNVNLTMWDERIPGSVLSAGMDTLINSSGDGASAFEDSLLGFFASGAISFGEIDGKGIQRNADINTTGLTLGADYRLTESRIVGAALGIVSDTTDFTGNNGDLNMDGFSLSLFGTWHKADKGYADFIVELGQNDFELSRRMNLPDAPDEFALGKTNATRMAFSLNVGRSLRSGAIEFGPSLRINFTRASIDGFTESSSLGSSGAATELSVDAQSVTSIRFAVGGEIKRPISTTKAVFVPTARLDFEVENKTDKGVITARFANDENNNPLSFQGTERDNNALVLRSMRKSIISHLHY